MAGLLSGLESLGLGKLENVDIFEKKKNEERAKQEFVAPKKPEMTETDYIYDKTFKCPVCDASFTAKIMRTGKARLLRTDYDLRPIYDGISAEKYDVLLCPSCGYAALGRYFSFILNGQARLIREHITKNVVLPEYKDDIYSYEQALNRYKLALACSVVKRCKNSEKAFVCLKASWLMRSYAEHLEASEGDNKALIDSLHSQEKDYQANAYKGFLEARSTEDFPIAGMDSTTLDYLLAQLSFRQEDYEVCNRMVTNILSGAGANSKIKERTKELKDKLLEITEKENE